MVSTSSPAAAAPPCFRLFSLSETVLNHINCLAVFILLTVSSVSQAGADIQDIVDSWVAAAESVASLELHIRGTDIRPTDDSKAQQSAHPPDSETKLAFEIEYAWRKPNSERYARHGDMPSPKGMRSFIQRRVFFKGESRELIEGGKTSYFPYDQYKFHEARPVRAIELQPVRCLLNLNHSGSEQLFNAHVFKLLPDGKQNIDGDECLLAESVEGQGVRIWFESSEPYRIRKMELMHLVADRAGHMEYVFHYRPKPGQRSPPDLPARPIEELTRWEITVFSATGEVRSTTDCQLTAATYNAEVPDSAFELPIPPGAFVTEYRTQRREYSLQLADGSRRPILPDQLGPDSVLRLSSSVPGSRVEGQVASPSLESNGLSRFWILILGNLVLVALFIAVYLRKRKAGRAE